MEEIYRQPSIENPSRLQSANIILLCVILQENIKSDSHPPTMARNRSEFKIGTIRVHGNVCVLVYVRASSARTTEREIVVNVLVILSSLVHPCRLSSIIGVVMACNIAIVRKTSFACYFCFEGGRPYRKWRVYLQHKSVNNQKIAVCSSWWRSAILRPLFRLSIVHNNCCLCRQFKRNKSEKSGRSTTATVVFFSPLAWLRYYASKREK